MTQEALKLALAGLEEWRFGGDPRAADKYITAIKEVLAQSTSGDYALGYSIGFGDGHSAKEFMAQPEQEPVVGTKTWFEDGEVVTQNLTASEIYKEPDEKEYLAKAYRMANELRCYLAIAPAPQRKPLTDADIEKLREKTFSTENPFCPVDSKSMRKAVRAAEAAHGIKGDA